MAADSGRCSQIALFAADATRKRTCGWGRRPGGLVALLLAAVLPAGGCGGGPYSSPEATFETFQTAASAGDWQQVCRCLTPESRDALAGTMVFMCWMARLFAPKATAAGQGGDEEPGWQQQFGHQAEGILNKHGVDDQDIGNVGIAEAQRDFRKLASLVSDKNQFIVDVLAAAKSINPDAKPFGELSGGRLANVEIRGDTATARTNIEGEGPIAFKRIDGQWKMDYHLGSAAARSVPSDK